MRKTSLLLVLMTFALTYTFSADVFAASSPIAETITDEAIDGNPDEEDEDPDDDMPEEGKDSDGSNPSDTSPKTGSAVPFALVALIGGAGVALISRKKLED